MKHIKLTLLLAFAPLLGASAQTDTTGTKAAAPTDAEAYMKQMLVNENQSLKAEVKTLQEQVAALRAAAAKGSAQGQSDSLRLAGLQTKNDQLAEQLADLTARDKALRDSLTQLDRLLYKQCLLYPLEIACDPSFIEKTQSVVRTFKALSPELSDKFVRYDRVYTPLLQRYAVYTQGLLDFVNDDVRPLLKESGGEISPAIRTQLSAKLKATPYYRECYVKRNTPPDFPSIPFLDKFVDKMEKIIQSEKGSVTAKVRELARSLHPND